MTKFIAVSDEVYRKLKLVKGDRSYNELIADRLRTTNWLADVPDQGILDGDARGAAKKGIEGLSVGTLTRLDDDS